MIATEKPTAKKQARIAVRLSDDHKAQMERAAAMTGQTLNSFVVSASMKQADEIVEKEEIRRLTNRDRDIFLALLDADPAPTKAATQAAARFNQGRHDGDQYHFKA